MSQLSFAMITPSFAPDFERCRLLAESILRYAASHVEHYIVVDRRDEKLFSSLRSPRTHIVVKQDILPRPLVQLPVSRTWWIDARSAALVRGWIVQQLTKLAVPAFCGADVYVFVDSDTFLVKAFDPRDSVRDGRVPMFRELLPTDVARHNVEWHRVAARLFGLPVQERYRTSYVTQLVTWRRDNLLRMQRQIERVASESWAKAVCACRTVSEYVLYGVFCEQVLQDGAGHYFEERLDTLHYWRTDALSEAKLRDLRATLQPEHVAVMISAKSHTPVRVIRRAFDMA